MSKKKTDGTVTVKFTVPSFRYKGTEYKSADVEKAAEEGDEAAMEIIAHLVRMCSGNIQVLSETSPSEDEDEDDDNELSDARLHIANLEAEIDTKNDAIAEKDSTINDLNIKVAELEAKIQELERPSVNMEVTPKPPEAPEDRTIDKPKKPKGGN